MAEDSKQPGADGRSQVHREIVSARRSTGMKSFENIQRQRHRARPLAQYAEHISGAQISRTVLAHVHALPRFSQPIARRNGADDVRG